MEGTLAFKFNNGSAVIYLPEFFPCTDSKFKKLRLLFREDWEHENEIYEILRAYFKQSADECDVVIKASADAYWRNAQKAADYKAMLESGKTVGGTPLTKQQIKDYKGFMKRCKDDMKSHERAAKKAEKDKAWFDAHLEVKPL